MIDEFDEGAEEIMFPSLQTEEMTEAEYREHEGIRDDEDFEDDGQPSDLQENEDFAHDGYFENTPGDEIL